MMPSDHEAASESPQSPPLNHQAFAAIDLGSNSFHMLIAERFGDSIRPIDSMREPVRLGAGLDKFKNLIPEAEQRALEALKLFAQRLRDVPRAQIRVVGTNTLRRARNSAPFMRNAHEILGVPIEIISGREEARLIYAAVAHTRPNPDAQRLVMDIGGGSTELVVGRGLVPSLIESVNLGCVSATSKHFDDGDCITPGQLQKATLQAQQELQPIAERYLEADWTHAIGCSGTFKATGALLAELGLSDGSITRKALRQALRRVVREGSIDKLKLQSINRERQQVIIGGMSIIRALMRSLKIDLIVPSQAALREGLIFEMLGRHEHVNLQQHSLSVLSERFLIEPHLAQRVCATAERLFNAAAGPWKLERDRDWPLLSWAAEVHAVGMGLSHHQYHKHGAYILSHSDLFGFTLAEQRALALLVRYHRRKIESEPFDALPAAEQRRLTALLALLRLAVLLNRAHYSHDFDGLEFDFQPVHIRLKTPSNWLRMHPLSAAELAEEASRLKAIGIALEYGQR